MELWLIVTVKALTIYRQLTFVRFTISYGFQKRYIK
jgi:hypothetical protein